ncbi:TIGR03750 family conjugal transfer protein, partial [Pseudomonas aeruginosa]
GGHRPGRSAADGFGCGLRLAWLMTSMAVVPTWVVAGIAVGVVVGGGCLSAQKRGRPDNWLDRQLQWRLALRHPALAALLGGQRLITRSGYWTTRRNADRGTP